MSAGQRNGPLQREGRSITQPPLPPEQSPFGRAPPPEIPQVGLRPSFVTPAAAQCHPDCRWLVIQIVALQTVDFLLRAKRDIVAAKAFFRQAFKSLGRLPRVITLDGYQASHRAAGEILKEHGHDKRTKIRSSKYLNNLIEQDHRSIKLRLGPMLGMKRFRSASIRHCRRRTYASDQKGAVQNRDASRQWQNCA